VIAQQFGTRLAKSPFVEVQRNTGNEVTVRLHLLEEGSSTWWQEKQLGKDVGELLQDEGRRRE
jgi:hypothetical protein